MKYIEAIIFWALFPIAVISYLWCFVETHWMAGKKQFINNQSKGQRSE